MHTYEREGPTQGLGVGWGSMKRLVIIITVMGGVGWGEHEKAGDNNNSNG